MTVVARAQSLSDRLLGAGLLFPTGVEGLYGRSGSYQAIVGGVDALMHRWGTSVGATAVHLPPVLARSTFDATDYMRSFPDLAGPVHVFSGTDRDHAELLGRMDAGGDWGALLEPSEVVLTPAACHGLYPMCAGRLPKGGRLIEVSAYCFRHEPSSDPARMQAFEMHEIVYLGSADEAQRHRDEGLTTGVSLLVDLGLDVAAVPATDPFFGRLGVQLAAGQRDEGLKFEGVVTIEPDRPPTAVMSANCHRDHFALPFGIETADGQVAHSACVGFGTDRIAIALLARHGMDSDRWPAEVRTRLFG